MHVIFYGPKDPCIKHLKKFIVIDSNQCEAQFIPDANQKNFAGDCVATAPD